MELSDINWSAEDSDTLGTVSSALTAQIPELLNEFYGWLMSERGGGREHLRDDQVPRLKRLQHTYWEEFFTGRIDATYLASRNKVGEVHAIVGLPAQVYLRALQAMERLFVRSVHEVETLSNSERNAAASAVQKLVQIDASIVLQAFAEHADDRARTQKSEHASLLNFLNNLAAGEVNTLIDVDDYHDDDFARALVRIQRRFLDIISQTAAITQGNYRSTITTAGPNDVLGQGLVRMRDRLEEIATLAERVARGDLSVALSVTSDEDALGSSVRMMLESTRAVVEQVRAVATGDYTVQIAPRSQEDELGAALSAMANALRESKENNDQQLWLIEAINRLSDQLRGLPTLSELASQALATLCSTMNASSGATYVRKPDTDTFVIEGAFAFTRDKQPGTEWQIGEGLVGQAALNNAPLILQPPAHHPERLRSTFLDASPHTLIIYPLSLNDRVIGLLEFAFMDTPAPRVHELLRLISESLTIALDGALSRAKTEDLLMTSTALTNELEAQKIEILATNRRLEDQTRTLEESEERTRKQSQEVEIVNQKLQAQNHALEAQAEELERRNAALDEAALALDERAQQLAESSRYKSEFLANMSHELRTPLNSMLLLSNHLAENARGSLSDDEVKSAQVIGRSGNDLLNLINEILDLAKIEAGRMDATIARHSVSPIVTGVTHSIAPLANEKNLELRVSCPDGLYVDTDRSRLGQILRNLLSNAVKFTERGSVTVEVLGRDVADTADITSEHLVFRVSDTGMGIPAHMVSTIFEAFQQADGGTSRTHGGTGLGLAISRQLAHLLGATLTLESTSPSGSVFELRHPIEQTPRLSTDASPRPHHSPPAPATSRLRENNANKAAPWNQITDDRDDLQPDSKPLLIIEDDLAFAAIARDFCRERDYQVIVASSGEEGLAMARECHPVGIFLDVQLPGVDGHRVLDDLKSDSRTRHIPVHFVSIEDATIHVLRKGAVGFLQKPVSEADLEGALARLENTFGRAVKDLLIVEDDDNMRLAIRKLLGNGDIKTTEASSGEECLHLLQSSQFDCMVLDLGLPDMSGFELLDKMQGVLDSYPPVIVYTGRDLSEAQAETLRGYAESIIIKGARSEERLLDETSIFLHRVIDNLPTGARDLLRRYQANTDTLSGRRILLVDDDMRNVFALGNILRDRGMEVVKAENGERAVAALRSDTFDLVLMDLMMPVMDGLTATKIIRDDLGLQTLPIIALTAKAMPEDRAKCIQAGATDYLTKPVDIERLCACMKALLS